jgi:LmbE family N-acetylglucosaminyl deacetylase
MVPHPSLPTLGELLRQGNPLGTAASQLLPARRVLVLAPHADDEVLGCGGVLLRYLDAGATVTIVYVTDGSFGETDATAPVRRREATAVGARLPGCEQSFWDLPDGGLLDRGAELSGRLAQAFDRLTPDIAFVPWLLDRHPDHMATALAAAASARRASAPLVFAAYEGLSAIPANHVTDITAVLEGKRELLALYGSQQRRHALDAVLALNHWRAMLLRRPAVQAAEAFHVATREDFVALAHRLFTHKKTQRKARG